MTKAIVSIGVEVPGGNVEHVRFAAKDSLLDWDIIVFRPDVSGLAFSYEEYNGKPCLDDVRSFQLKEACEHWRRELRQAFEAGKTIIVYLSPRADVFVATGSKEFSGTGRNRVTTRHVAPYENYRAIPADISAVSARGSAMKLAPSGTDFLAAYWATFGKDSTYNVRLEKPSGSPCVVTKTGDVPVGVVFRSKKGPGAMLLLPDIDFDAAEFVELREGEEYWSKAASQFGQRFVKAIVDLDKALKSSSEVTPEPEWASTDEFALVPELALRSELLQAEEKAYEAQRSVESLRDQLAESGRLRGLLYEKGKALEQAIIEALRLMGFKAVPYREGDSEFDVVFDCPEGRLLGEAEGKNSKAINIDKMRQLAMNINEDLQRNEVDEPAKPVLFGNACRLKPLSERPEPFTEKCIKAADQSSTALVFTPDLFLVAQYLSGTADQKYAQKCRQAMVGTIGRVAFPIVPQGNRTLEEAVVTEEE